MCTTFTKYFLLFNNLHKNTCIEKYKLCLFSPTDLPVTLKILQNWVPRVSHYFDKEHYTYVGHQIVIQESIEHFGAVVWPGVCTRCGTQKADTTEG